MALTDGNDGGMVMPVAPMYGGGNNGFGFGGDWAWIILLLLLGWGNNGWGNGGFGGGVGSEIYPWMNQANLTSDGFQNQLMNDNITSIRDGVHELSTQLCNCCSDTQMALMSGFAGAEASANARQIADMQSAFALQSQLADCCCENRLASADLKYTIATEECATRSADAMNTRDIIDSQTRGTQAILDKLCALELDGLKQDNANLRTQLNMANLAASQIKQTADIQSNIVNELRACPIPSQPVYGVQPIFTCGGNSGCGCGSGAF